MVEFNDRRVGRVTALNMPVVSTDRKDGTIAERKRAAELAVGSVFPRRRDIRAADKARDEARARAKKKMK
jgi:hypothetical protein